MKNFSGGLIKTAVCMTLGLGLVTIAWAQGKAPAKPQADERAQLLIAMYMQACLMNVGQNEKVLKLMDGQKVPKLPAEVAKQLLGGQPGMAWAMQNPLGQFFVALQPNTGLCSVMAQTANPQDVTRIFELIAVPGNSKDLVVQKIMDKQVAGNPGVIRHLGYRWLEKNNPKSGLEMMLSTVTGGNANSMQAILRSQPVRQ